MKEKAKTQTLCEFADGTANPELTYAIMSVVNGGEGMVVTPAEQVPPDIVFNKSSDNDQAD